MRRSFTSPLPTGISYFAATWTHKHTDEPTKFWYEIDGDGSCVREVKVHRNGRMSRDAVANYPGGVTDFGFGTLHGASFWDSEWDEEPDDFGESTSISECSKDDFEAAWSRAGE